MLHYFSTQIRIDYKRKALDDDVTQDGKMNVASGPPLKRRNYGAPALKRQPVVTAERRQPVPSARANLIDEGYFFAFV